MVNMQYYPPLKRHKFTSRGQGQRKRKHYTSSAAVPTYTCACSAHIANETKRGFERRIFKTSELILHPAVSLVKAKGERKKKEVLLKKYSPRFLSSLPPFLATSDNCHSAFKNERNRPMEYLGKKRNRITEMAQYHSCTTRWHSLKGYTPETRLFASDNNSHTQDKTIARQARLPITASQGAQEEHRGKGDHLTLYIHFVLGRKKNLLRYIHNYIHLLLLIPLYSKNKSRFNVQIPASPQTPPPCPPARFIYIYIFKLEFICMYLLSLRLAVHASIWKVLRLSATGNEFKMKWRG